MNEARAEKNNLWEWDFVQNSNNRGIYDLKVQINNATIK